VLGVEDVGPWAHFFQLGGTSLTEVAMIRRLPDALPEHARFRDDRDHIKVRLCGLHRRPRLRDYARLLDFAGLSPPTTEAGADRLEQRLKQSDREPATAEEILAHLDAGVAADDASALGADALVIAARGGHVEVVKALLAVGVSPNGRAATGQTRVRTPLMAAASADHAGVVVLLLAASANVNRTDSSQSGAAHVAAESSVSVLNLLLNANAALGARDLNRWTPLHRAAWAGNVASVEALVARSADLAAKDRWSRTPLGLAVFKNRLDVAESLFRLGAPLHPKFEGGRSRPQVC
jgi:ankyrin repeat protein